MCALARAGVRACVVQCGDGDLSGCDYGEEGVYDVDVGDHTGNHAGSADASAHVNADGSTSSTGKRGNALLRLTVFRFRAGGLEEEMRAANVVASHAGSVSE